MRMYANRRAQRCAGSMINNQHESARVWRWYPEEEGVEDR